jgi:hypothetical protein
MTSSDSRAERAERLRALFELQLQLSRRLAELTGRSLSDVVLHSTSLHRRFGLGRVKGGAASGWVTYAAAVDRLDDLAAQVALTQATFRAAPDVRPDPGRTRFGCFACEDDLAADGSVAIHFSNADTDSEGGPLAAAKLARRRAEIADLVAHVCQRHPQIRHIRGRSWLYNLPAYRRIFPADYGASATPYAGPPLKLDGNTFWGQAVDSEERVRPEVRDAVLAALPTLDPAAPGRAFPMPVLVVRAPIESFRAEYGLAAA